MKAQRYILLKNTPVRVEKHSCKVTYSSFCVFYLGFAGLCHSINCIMSSGKFSVTVFPLSFRNSCLTCQTYSSLSCFLASVPYLPMFLVPRLHFQTPGMGRLPLTVHICPPAYLCQWSSIRTQTHLFVYVLSVIGSLWQRLYAFHA